MIIKNSENTYKNSRLCTLYSKKKKKITILFIKDISKIILHNKFIILKKILKNINKMLYNYILKANII